MSHSEIPGFKVVCTYPGLIAAYHVLHRLHVPRHPPYALSNFIKVISSYNEATYVISKLSKNKKFCGASRDRTDDPLVANQVLSQLSYSPKIFIGLTQVGLRGLEPRTSSLSGMRSNHLSYKPKIIVCVITRFEFDRILQSVRLLLRKEVIQPHLPVRLPCYDFAPVTSLTLTSSLPKVKQPALGTADFHGVTGGVYKTRERIHRGMLIHDY